MKLVPDWWKRREQDRPDGFSGWPISAPFIISIQFESERNDADWCALIKAVTREHTELFFEGGDLLASDLAASVLQHAEACGARFHIETAGNWPDPASTIHLLKTLKHLASLRMRIASASDAAVLADLRHAVASGITVWGVVAPDGAGRLREIALPLFACGVAGVAVRGGDSAEVAELRRDGYAVIFDECPPSGLDEHTPCRCSGGFGSCVIDGRGRVRLCRRDSKPIGSLFETTLEELWSMPALQERRHAHGSHHGLCQSAARGDAFSGVAGDGPALDPDLVPLALYRMQPEPFGAVLIDGFEFVAVSAEGARIAAAFDGTRMLADLEREFGGAATSLAYSLFSKKWLRFRRSADGAGKDGAQ